MRWMLNLYLYDQDQIPTLHMASVKPGAHRIRALSTEVNRCLVVQLERRLLAQSALHSWIVCRC